MNLVWIVNGILWWMFTFNPPVYHQMVEAGASCWYQIPAPPGLPFPPESNIQPACWYDPSNTNSGLIGAPHANHLHLYPR